MPTNDGHLTATERANNQAAFAMMSLAQLRRCYEDGKQYVRLYPDVPCYQEQQELNSAALNVAELDAAEAATSSWGEDYVRR